MIHKLIKKETIFLTLGFLLLLISYTFNTFQITDNNYRLFDKSDEALVVGRIMISRQEGILYNGALPGGATLYKYELEENEEPPYIMSLVSDGNLIKIDGLDFNQVAHQRFNDFISDRKLQILEWEPYKTQPGGQIFMYVLLDQILPLSGKAKLDIFRLITILLSTLALLLFVKWVLNNYGFVAALVTLVLIFISPWFFRFAFNLWWALWSYYIPFLTMLFLLDKNRKQGNCKLDFRVYCWLFFSVFLKFFFTGAEFISTTLVMAVCPIIYHLFITKVDLKTSIFYLLKSTLACLSGVLAGMFLLITQIRIYAGNWTAGLDHIIYSFVKRSPMTEGADTFNLWDVVLSYFKREMFYHENFPSLSVSFGTLYLIITIISIFLYYMSRKLPVDTFMRNKALVLTTAISVLAPLSWIVLFVEHAYTHDMIDHIVWYMPYFLYGFCVIGVFCQLCINLYKNRIKI